MNSTRSGISLESSSVREPEQKTTKTFRFLSITRDGPVEDSHFEFKPLEGWKILKKDDEFDRDEHGFMRNAAEAFNRWIGMIY